MNGGSCASNDVSAVNHACDVVSATAADCSCTGFWSETRQQRQQQQLAGYRQWLRPTKNRHEVRLYCWWRFGHSTTCSVARQMLCGVLVRLFVFLRDYSSASVNSLQLSSDFTYTCGHYWTLIESHTLQVYWYQCWATVICDLHCLAESRW